MATTVERTVSTKKTAEKQQEILFARDRTKPRKKWPTLKIEYNKDEEEVIFNLGPVCNYISELVAYQNSAK